MNDSTFVASLRLCIKYSQLLYSGILLYIRQDGTPYNAAAVIREPSAALAVTAEFPADKNLISAVRSLISACHFGGWIAKDANFVQHFRNQS